MKTSRWLLFSVCWLAAAPVFSQDSVFVFGLAANDGGYVAAGNVDTSLLNRNASLPAVFSYRQQIKPQVDFQGILPACVAYSIARALQIRLNWTCNWCCKCRKNLEAFSAAFIYNQVSGGQRVPIRLDSALNLLSRQGICLEKTFANNPYSAAKQPGRKEKEAAQTFNFWQPERLFYLPDEMPDPLRRKNLMLDLLRGYVSGGYPVIVGLRCPDDFLRHFQKEKYAPDPSKLPTEPNHAAVVTGYDDRAREVEIQNSFGTRWGKDGFVRIAYDDFFQMARYGYIVRATQQTCDKCPRK